MSTCEKSTTIPSDCIANVFGQFDSNIKKIERHLAVTMVLRDTELKVMGEEANVDKTIEVIHSLVALARRGNTITEQNVNYALSLSAEHHSDTVVELDKDIICHTVNGKPVKAKTIGQKQYLNAIDKNMIVFGVGPAGTGKTYLAMAKAITAFKNDEVNRIILTRPAIEAGEKLGFLPGDLKDKLDPYLQPLYDALGDMIPPKKLQEFIADGTIQIAPLAYMRGRTLDRACVILDEAQNTNLGQLKMFLTRMGRDAKFIVTGDASQVDLPNKSDSGLLRGMKLVEGIKGIACITFTNADIVRHPLVTKIVKAFDGE